MHRENLGDETNDREGPRRHFDDDEVQGGHLEQLVQHPLRRAPRHQEDAGRAARLGQGGHVAEAGCDGAHALVDGRVRPVKMLPQPVQGGALEQAWGFRGDEAAPHETGHENADDGYRMLEIRQRILQSHPGLNGAIRRTDEVHDLELQPRSDQGRKRLFPLQAESRHGRLAGEDQRRRGGVDRSARNPPPFRIRAEADLAARERLDAIHGGRERAPVARMRGGEGVHRRDQLGAYQPVDPPSNDDFRGRQRQEHREQQTPARSPARQERDEDEQKHRDCDGGCPRPDNDAAARRDEKLLRQEHVLVEPGPVTAPGKYEESHGGQNDHALCKSAKHPQPAAEHMPQRQGPHRRDQARSG